MNKVFVQTVISSVHSSLNRLWSAACFIQLPCLPLRTTYNLAYTKWIKKHPSKKQRIMTRFQSKGPDRGDDFGGQEDGEQCQELEEDQELCLAISKVWQILFDVDLQTILSSCISITYHQSSDKDSGKIEQWQTCEDKD